jgi:hypothetical protein
VGKMELMENLGMQMSLDTMEISMQLHLKTKVELAYHSSLSILYIPEGVKPASTSDICIPMVMAVVFRRAKSWNHHGSLLFKAHPLVTCLVSFPDIHQLSSIQLLISLNYLHTELLLK